MGERLTRVLEKIEKEHMEIIEAHGRNYIEVDIAKTASELGYGDLARSYRNVCAIVPLRGPVPGMKVRVDGRTFAGYRQYTSGVAVPGYVARQIKIPSRGYAARHSMICNFA